MLWAPQRNFVHGRPDEQVIANEAMTLLITYPLTKLARVPLQNKGGFTRKQLVQAIVVACKCVYAKVAEKCGASCVWPRQVHEESSADVRQVRRVIEDLFLEGIEYDSDGKLVTLTIDN